MKLLVLGLGICTFLAAATDPPSRVGRLSFVEGPVSFRPANVQDWTPATLNYPLTSGDSLSTGDSSYAEIHIGATAIHLPPQSVFELSYLDDASLQMSLSQGAVYVRIPVLGDGEKVEVDTPNGAISLVQAGSYRVDVDVQNKATSLTVREGEADVAQNGGVFQVLPGRMLQMVGDQEIRDTQDALAPDDWEKSCAARDLWAEQSRESSDSYVPADMDGAEDLAEYGTWSVDASYGAMWYPSGMNSGWAPYRNGHWASVPPWGWTWIDDAPWGFAPFHYGRWVFQDGRWFWVPGGTQPHPIYAPALVAFFGGHRMSAALTKGLPVVAWVPLGPREAYRPPYPASAGYVQRLNAGASDGSATYRNRDQMIAVPQATLTAAQPVAAEAVRVPRGAATGAERVNVDPPVMVAAPARAIVKHEVPGAPRTIAAPVPAAPVVSEQAPAETIQRQEEQQRLQQQQQADQQRAEQQQRADQQRSQQQAEQQRAEQQRAEQQRAEQQRAEQQRAEQQRSQQQAEQQRAEQQRAEQQRAEQQRAEQQRAEQQRSQQQAEQQRAEQQRAEQQRAEQQRAEQQRAEQQRAEQQRAEQQRAEEARKAEEAKKADEARKKG